MNENGAGTSAAVFRSLKRIRLRAGIVLPVFLILLAAILIKTGQRSSLPDFTDLEPNARKAAFFEYLDPIVAQVNDASRADLQIIRDLTEKSAQGAAPTWFERRRIESLAGKYEVETEDRSTDEILSDLHRRAGAIPRSLALIQAAKESGWGTSRFALEGNNLFGQRCYESDCGIEPLGRNNPRFGLAEFSSVEESVESYVLNLNTHPKYREFRNLRQAARAQDKRPGGLDLVQGLMSYSERGQAYVDEIRAMIRQNSLE